MAYQKKSGKKSLYGKTKNITADKKPKHIAQDLPSPDDSKPAPMPTKPEPKSIPKDHPKKIQKGRYSDDIKRVTKGGESKETPGGPSDGYGGFAKGGSKYKAGV
tara:strand:+ start:569 stop:880 length:312 start_codon:yes stop_codon:yes gene_type:complete